MPQVKITVNGLVDLDFDATVYEFYVPLNERDSKTDEVFDTFNSINSIAYECL